MQVGGGLGDAEVDGGLLDLGGADVLGHLRVHRVHRVVGGGGDVDVAVVAVVLVGGRVAGGTVRSDHLALVVAVVEGVRGDRLTVLGGGFVGHRRGEDEWLESGSHLVVTAGRVVDELLGVVDSAVEGDDLPGLGVDRGAARADVPVDLAVVAELAHQPVADGLRERVLLALVDRGGDPVAAPGQGLLVDDAVAGEVVLDRFDQVAALSGHAGGGLGLGGLGEGHLGALGATEPVLLDHAVEDVVPARLGPRLVLRVGDDVVRAGGVEQGGQVGALGGVQLVDVLAVVRLGGGLDAVGVAAEVAGVEVALEDLVLAHLAIQLDRDEELLALAGDRLFLVQVVVLHILLGDRGAGLLALAGGGVPGGPDHGLGVDRGLGVEVPVLGGEHRVLGPLGHLAELHVLPVDLALAGERGAVGVEEDIALGDGRLVGRRDVDEQIAGDQRARDEHEEQQRATEHHPPGGEQPAPAGAPGAALSARGAAVAGAVAAARAAHAGRAAVDQLGLVAHVS